MKKNLEPGIFKPADLKMLMLAFDTNRNGRIEQAEFEQAFLDARSSGVGNPQLAMQRQESHEAIAPGFDRPATSSGFKGAGM